jgi:pyrimidine operon attenuation protein/uracil phosphoribosyltransferase
VVVALAETHQFQMDKMVVLVEAVLYQDREVLAVMEYIQVHHM